MTEEELSNEFDALLSAINPNITLDEYEKSIYLTLAQEELVKSLYNGKYTGESFEKTEELRRYLDSLLITATLEETTGDGLSDKSTFYSLPTDKNTVWFIIYEQAKLSEGYYCKNNTTVDVVPIRHDEWDKIKKNPFKMPSKKRIVRIDSEANKLELISKYPIESYTIKYLKKPSPIVLTYLEDELTIDGVNTPQTSELNAALHRPILELAVELANKRATASK